MMSIKKDRAVSGNPHLPLHWAEKGNAVNAFIAAGKGVRLKRNQDIGAGQARYSRTKSRAAGNAQRSAGTGNKREINSIAKILSVVRKVNGSA